MTVQTRLIVQAVHTLLTCDYSGWKRFDEKP